MLGLRRRVRTAVVAVTVLALFAGATPAWADPTPPPPPPPTTPAQEALRANVETVLSGLQGVVDAVRANPQTAYGLASTGTDPAAMIVAAQQQVATLNSTELDQLQAGLAQDPTWQSIPAALARSVATFKPPSTKLAAKDFGGTFTDSCNSAGSAPDEFVATKDANEVQSAAQALMLATPGVVALFFVDVPTGAKIAFAVIWGVADGVYLALAQTLAVSTDCAQTAFANTQVSTLPVDPANSNVNVRASSEISVQSLITAATGTQTEITNVQTTVKTIKGQADTLTTAAGVLNTTVNDINTRVSEVQSDLKALQTNVAVLQNTEITVLGKADTEIAKLTAFQTLQLRMDIEENLTRNGGGSGPVGLFQLPSSKGGYLDTVKSIVTDTIAKETANGRGSAKANSDLATANGDFTAGGYKAAYSYYTKAYQDVR